MEKTVKVSVIMLAYNIENYIEIAIKGVLSQKTDYPVELIIGEDRSTTVPTKYASDTRKSIRSSSP